MNLGKLVLKNYLSYAQAEVDFNNMGKVLIVGMNNGDPSESNAAGKTNLFEAIGWNGWGESKAETIDLNVKDGEDSCSVEHHFEHDGKQTSIIRTRNRKNGSSTLDLIIDGVVSNGSSVTDTNKKISEFLSLDYDTFVNSVYIRQDDVYSLANSKNSSAGRDLLEKILNLNIYEKYYLQVKDKIKDLDFHRIAIAEFIELHKDAQDKISAIMEQQQVKRDEVETLKKDLVKKEMELEESGTAYESLRNSEFQLQTLLGEVSRIKLAVAEAKTSLADVRSKAISFKEDQDRKALEISDKINGEPRLLEEKNEIESELSRAKEKAAQIKELEEELADISARHAEQVAIASGPEKDIHFRNSLITNLIEEIEELNLRIKTPAIKDGDVCDHCLTAINSSNLEHYIEILSGKIIPKKEKLLTLTRENARDKGVQDIANTKITELGRQIESLQGKISTKKKISQLDELLEGKLGLIQGKLSDINKLRSDMEAIRSGTALLDWKDTVKNKKLDLTARQAELDEASARLVNINVDTGKIDSIKTNIANLKKNIDEIKFKIFDSTKNIELLEKDREGFDIIIGQKKEKRKILQGLDEDHAVYSDLLVAFSPKGIRSYILETAVEELEKEANSILGKLSSNRLSITFKTKKEAKKSKQEKLTFEVLINDGQKTFPFTSYSGGQKFRISFVLRVALSKLLLRRAHSKLEFLIIDEAVSPLDGRGVEQIIEVINELQNEFKTILVITHRNDVKQYFEKILTVNMTPDGSVLEK